jgi:hypothetical protein
MGAKIDEKEYQSDRIPGTRDREIRVPGIQAPRAKTIQNLDINHQIGVLCEKKLRFS